MVELVGLSEYRMFFKPIHYIPLKPFGVSFLIKRTLRPYADVKEMAKRSRSEVKKDEKKVLTLLQSHAKDSLETIAKKCGFSVPKVRRIIKTLEGSNTIWGYHAVTDYEKYGLHEYLLLIKKTNRPADDLVDTILSRRIEKQAEELDVLIESSYYLHGLFDWLICFVAKDLKHAKKFESELVKTYKSHIQETHLMETIFPVKRNGIQNPELHKLKEFL